MNMGWGVSLFQILFEGGRGSLGLVDRKAKPR